MKSLVSIALAFALVSPTAAQTVGVPFYNLLEIEDEFNPGVWLNPGPCGNLQVSVSSGSHLMRTRVCTQMSGMSAFLYAATTGMGGTGLCTPCAAPWPATTCVGAPPASACASPPSNQSVDITSFNIPYGPAPTGTVGSSGACRAFVALDFSTIPNPTGLIGKTVSLQGGVFWPGCTTAVFDIVLSNAIEVTFVP